MSRLFPQMEQCYNVIWSMHWGLQHGSRPHRRSGPALQESLLSLFLRNILSLSFPQLTHWFPAFCDDFSSLFHEYFIHTASRCSQVRKTKPGCGWASCSRGTRRKRCLCKRWWWWTFWFPLKRRTLFILGLTTGVLSDFHVRPCDGVITPASLQDWNL